MHSAVKDFIKEVRKEFPYKFRFKTVLEIGSHNINGSPRKYFWFCKYVGIDISKGKGVDIVTDICNMKYGGNFEAWHVVISCEMLEHCSEWRKALERMYHFTKPGGLLLITCASDERLEHGTKRTTPFYSPDTTDYYRNILKVFYLNLYSLLMF